MGTGDVMVLGGGLAGLSAAYHGGLPLYEARDSCGGTADSFLKDGFVFDAGVHILQSKIPYFHDLMKKLGVEMVSHQRRAWIYSHGSYTPYPFQVNSNHLPLGRRIRCVADFLLRTRRKYDPQNYEEWLVQNFGQGFASTFLIPYSEKFWRVPPREMTFEWAASGRVPVPRIKDVVLGAFRDHQTALGTHSEYQYPKKPGAGFAEIARALASRIGEVCCGMEATAIHPEDGAVVFNGGERTVTYKRLISTLPLPALIGLLPSPPAEVLSAAGRLRHNSMVAVNLGIGRPDVTKEHWIHFPEHEVSFCRISFPHHFAEGLVPTGTSAIQAEASYDRENPPDPDALVETMCRDLTRVGVLRPNDSVVFQDVLYQPYGYVVYDHARVQTVSEIHAYLHSLNIYPCGRYGSWEYLWSDEAIMDGKAAAERVLALEDE